MVKSSSKSNPQSEDDRYAGLAASALLRLPYTKKKKHARPIKKSVPVSIFTSYTHSDLICCAGKNAKIIPKVVVNRPLAPDRSKTGLE